MWKLIVAIHAFIFLVTCKDAVAQTACSTLSCLTNPSCTCVDPTTGLSWTILLPIIVSVAFSVLSAIICCCCSYFRRKKNAKVTTPTTTTENIRIVRDYDPAVVVGPPTLHQPPVFNLAPLSVMSSQYLRPAMYQSPQLMGPMGTPRLMGAYDQGWPASSPYMSRPMIGYPGGCQSCTL